MKRKIALFTLLAMLAFALTSCGEVSFEEQNKTMPLEHVLGEDAPADAAHLYRSATLYEQPGNVALHYLSGKLYAFTFSTVPGEGTVSQQYDSLLSGLTADYGKPSSTSDEGVALWSSNGLANTITLTSHESTAQQSGYVSLTFCGKFSALTALDLVPEAFASEFEEESLLSSLLDTTRSDVLAALGPATETSIDEAGTGAVVYDNFACGALTGVLQVSFYEDRSYSAVFSLSSLTGSCAPEDYYALSAKTRAAHKDPKQEYCLGYAEEDSVSQTQYQLWKNVMNKFSAELIYYTTPEGDVLQYGLTASWMLSNRPAMQAVMGD